ncbi:MAG TPA: lysine--tRNA ligase [Sneathiellales bacterium]|nr:lysine--tRNA ligase [Sneathiellales bacterium]
MDAAREKSIADEAWPFEEARKIVNRLESAPDQGHTVLFEAAYCPSSPPHIDTFGEIARTAMVRQAFDELSDEPTRLIIFSEDMDALRKVPENLPNHDKLNAHLGMPLTAVPDPSGKRESVAAHNVARLHAVLDVFDFAYGIQSATGWYKSGRFDPVLIKVLEDYDAITEVVLPTIEPDRRATYSPFLPVCKRTGRVLQVPVVERKVGEGTIVYRDEDGTLIETPVTGGACKLQSTVDTAMRWVARKVDYEVSGKDRIDSVNLSRRLAEILGGRAPEWLSYEMLIDENGAEISKARGNGLTIEEWLSHGSVESLALFMYQSPHTARRLSFDVIPGAVDDYREHLAAYADADAAARLANPVWHIHAGDPPTADNP